MTPNKGGRKYAIKGKIDLANLWIENCSVPEARADLVGY